ncbi:hypothetical protein Tco_0554069 [Tanacetum coccineum]
MSSYKILYKLQRRNQSIRHRSSKGILQINEGSWYFTQRKRNHKIIQGSSTDDDESENDDEEDDASIDIEKTDDKRTNTDVEDHVKGVVEMNIAEEAEEENTERVEEQKDIEELKADEEQKGDDQAGDEQVVVPVSTTPK